MDADISISFKHEGAEYNGILSPVHGASGETWNLMINKYYCGRLRKYNSNWVFDATPKTVSFSTLADIFGAYVTGPENNPDQG